MTTKTVKGLKSERWDTFCGTVWNLANNTYDCSFLYHKHYAISWDFVSHLEGCLQVIKSLSKRTDNQKIMDGNVRNFLVVTVLADGISGSLCCKHVFMDQCKTQKDCCIHAFFKRQVNQARLCLSQVFNSRQTNILSQGRRSQQQGIYCCVILSVSVRQPSNWHWMRL